MIWSCPGRLDVAANEASWESVQVNGGSDAMLSQAMKQSDNKCVGPTVRDRGWNEPDAFVTPAWKALPHVWIISQGNNCGTFFSWFASSVWRDFYNRFSVLSAVLGNKTYSCVFKCVVTETFLCCLSLWDTRPIRAYRRIVRFDWIVFCVIYSCEKQELFRGIIISRLWLMRFCVVCRSGIQDLFGRISTLRLIRFCGVQDLFGHTL